MEALLSEDVKIIASALKAAIDKDRKSTSKREAETGIRYYNHENDIMNNRIFYVDDEGVLREDKYASNVRIPHGFFPEIVDQKLNTFYLILLNTKQKTKNLKSI